MSVRLHRCPNEWVELSAHPCWKVQKALDDPAIAAGQLDSKRPAPSAPSAA